MPNTPPRRRPAFPAVAPVPSEIPRAQRGAHSELLACAELLRLGYHVYRCESPHAPFDLVAYRDGQCWRVEVKSISESPAPAFPWPKNDEWDLLLVVGRLGVLMYESSMASGEVIDSVRAAYGFGPSSRNVGLREMRRRTASIAGAAAVRCGRCGHLPGHHWPDDSRSRPGCQLCLCSNVPEEIACLSA